jgi:hypothetical protein
MTTGVPLADSVVIRQRTAPGFSTLAGAVSQASESMADCATAGAQSTAAKPMETTICLRIAPSRERNRDFTERVKITPVSLRAEA